MNKIVIASNNQHKINEFNKILGREDVKFISQSELNITEAAETGLTFVENAILKARNACLFSGIPSIADDSGIEVDALSGRPGIYSARYAGDNCDDYANNKLLLKELSNVPFERRNARYHCAIVFLSKHDCSMPKIFNATWEGVIGSKEIGDNGFGYDPLFFLPTLNCTAAELSEDEKNTISHRGKALNLFKKEIKEIILKY
ncbi:MAG: RdgB/HAM1 family non-canonical purine NTP pyrophosphatase [Gammaproteobacteria bacterium]|jgi:XTP/dITP diphosphohydrolase|nr:RdgB/HAM1 family non-canonical purine NTP pyrophosphatase [Gammaproteobacteria bacterium]MBT7603831.1 RdgB/HAM1 family non-canonical purine NTP pyrophosphatase [Gammaproteobacteria bacterium]